MFPDGKDVIAFVVNTAINGDVALAFKDPNGIDHAFVRGERLIITEIVGNNRVTAKDITIYQDTNGSSTLDAGEQIAVLSFAGVGVVPLVFAGLPSKAINAAATNLFRAVASAAGAVDLLIKGEVIKG